MYNGIGIQSTRGTGTSGHVQRNVAALHRAHRRRTSNPNPNQTLRTALLKKSADAQRVHEQRRRVEVAVAELEEELNARGYDHDTIASMAQRLRDDLLSRGEDEGKGERDRELEKGHRGTDLVIHRNEKMRGLLGVQEGYVEGSGFRNMRPREEQVDVDDHAPNSVTLAPTPAPKDTAAKDVLKDTMPKDPRPEVVQQENMIEGKPKVDAPSDTESSSLSESSGESDPDDVPEVRDKVVQSDNAHEMERKRVRLIEPATPEPQQQNKASLTRSPQRSPIRRSPPRRSEYARRSRSRSSSPLSSERGRESPYHREASPRRRDLSPYSGKASPRRRDPAPYDRTPPPRKRSRDRSPYDRNPTPGRIDLYRRPYDYRRSRYKRSPRQRRSRYRSRSPSRSRSRSRSFSRDRGRRYRDDSPDSLSTSSGSESPYGRRPSAPYGRSPSPRRRLSPYSGRSSRHRSSSPYSRKRRLSYYSPPRRVRYRTRSPERYRYRRRRERQEREHRYGSSGSDSSRSPPRPRTPPRRSRFSDYPTPSSPNLAPRRPQRYSPSPAD